METMTYKAPELSREEATPRRVRDELANCLVTAFGSVRRMPNASPNPIQLRNDVDRFIRGIFADAGANYDEPTAESLRAVLDEWRKQGGTFIGDATVIQHHWTEMNKLVSQIG